VVFDQAGMICAMNPAAERMYGYQAAELVGGSAERLMSDPDREKHAGHLSRTGVTGLVHWLGEQVEGWGRRRNGELFPLEVSLAERPVGDGRVFTALIRDVSERKRAEAEIREGEARYAELFRSASEGLILIDARLPDRLTYEAVNPAMMAATGLTEERLLGRTALEVFGEAKGRELEDRYRDCIEKATPIEWRQAYDMASGRRTFHTIISPLRDPAGKVSRLLISGRDITQWESDREALNESERRYSDILGALPAAVYTTDAEGVITYFNPAAVEFAGRTPELGKDRWCVSWKLRHADGTLMPHDECPMAVAVKEDRSPRGLEAVAERPDGSRVAFTPYPTPLHDKAGKLVGAVNVLVDITERREAEKSLRALEEKFRLLFDNSAEALFLVGRAEDDVIRYERINRAGEQLLRRDNAMVQGKSPDDLLPPHVAEAITAGYEACIAQGSTHDIEDTFEIDGQSRSFHTLIVPLHEADGGVTRVLASSRETTERKSLEARLRASQKLEALGQLAGGVAHDFNNLLLIIDGYTRLAQQERDCEELEEVLKAAERGAALVKQLLVFGHRQVLEVEPVCIGEALLDLQPLLRPLLDARYTLTTEVSPEVLTARVKTDAAELTQALINLVVNARDAMADGGVIVLGARGMARTAEERVHDLDLQPGDYVEISVQDQGSGIPDALLGRIFDPFFTTKGPGAGTGLGLAMVHGYARQSGGSVTAESRPGEGATLRLLLPLCSEEVVGAVPRPAPRVSAADQTVLLVEDDPQLLRLNRRTLQDLGYRVLSASNGFEALEVEAAFEGAIALVLTDVVMPQLGGFELADLLRASRPEARVVFTSGYPTRGPVQSVTIPEGAIFLPKPFTPAELARVLLRASGGGAASQAA
jgi:PAS domain S-box-containing protein